MAARSHYDVLGVSPGAKPDAVRRAYLRQARRWHPDRPSGDAEQMRAVNGAWQILGNARSRAAYDRSLARQPGTSPAPSPPRHTASTRPAESPPKAPSASTLPLEMVAVRWRWISLAAAALVAVALALVFIATSGNDTPTSISQTVSASQPLPEPGECFVIGLVTIAPVGCDQPHDGKLSAWVSLGVPCPPNNELHWVRAAQRAVCYQPPTG